MLGRFLQADPTVPNPGNPQDLNRYSYVRNAPLAYVDPDGRNPIAVIAGFVVAGGFWLSNPSPVNAPDVDALTIERSSYGDRLFLDTAPGSGDISDIYAAATGQRLFTGDPQNRAEAAAFAVVPFAAGGVTTYLRHVNGPAFESLVSLGKHNAGLIDQILIGAGVDSVIRGYVDSGRRQIRLRAGDAETGLRHIVGRHLTGTMDKRGDASRYKDWAKVGDIMSAIEEVLKGSERVRSGKHWRYEGTSKLGTLRVIVSDEGEVVSAIPLS